MSHTDDQLALSLSPDSPAHETLRAVVGIVADHRNSVGDQDAIEVAFRIVDAFIGTDVTGNLTASQIAYRAELPVDDPTFASRFDLLKHERVLIPRGQRAHQVRYTLNPAAYSGRLVFERLQSDRGVSELVSLLDHTVGMADRGATTEDVQASLARLITLLRLHTEALTAALDAPIAELYEKQRAHSIGSFAEQIAALHTTITSRYPTLIGQARQLLGHVEDYQDALNNASLRMADEGMATRTFVMLPAEAFHTAALTLSEEDLAAIVDGLLFDPAPPWMSAATVAAAAEQSRGRTGPRQRPPLPPVPPDGPDPTDRAVAEALRRTEELQRLAERLLGGADHVDLTRQLSTRWAGTAALIADLAEINRNPDLPYAVAFSNAVIVDPAGPVSYLAPTDLSRTTPSGLAHAPLGATNEHR